MRRHGRTLLVAWTLGLALLGCESPPPASPTALPRAAAEAPADGAEVVISTEPWTFESRDGLLVRTPSYRVYTTVTRPQLLTRVPPFLERCLINYTTALGDLPRPPAPMETYLMANRPQWERLTQRVMGSQADVYLKIQRGGFAADGRAVLYDIGRMDTFAITAHEGWHQYTQRTFRSPLPVAIEEGLATYMEGFRWDPENPDRPRFLPWANFERFEQLRSDSAAGRLMSLTTLQQRTPQEIIEQDPDRALTYYAQVWALVHFLNEGEDGRHRAALRSMLRDAASGDLFPKVRAHLGGRAVSQLASKRTGPDVIGLYTGASVESLEQPYRDFIARVVRVGSRQRIAAGKSPIPDE
jgi:hypothetical protein